MDAFPRTDSLFPMYLAFLVRSAPRLPIEPLLPPEDFMIWVSFRVMWLVAPLINKWSPGRSETHRMTGIHQAHG